MSYRGMTAELVTGFLSACHTKSIDALATLWGRPRRDEQGRADRESADRADPVRQGSVVPMLGFFGSEGRAPTPEQVDSHEAELKKHGKDYEFHRYDGAGHGFFDYGRPMYRVEQAADGWKKVWAFVSSNLRPDARVAVEISLESAKALAAALSRAIAAAEEVEDIRLRNT